MKMKKQFKTIILDNQEREFKDITPREYDIPMKTKKIVSLIGVRRCGKTYILYSLIEKFRKKVAKENIVFINFEDDRLFPISLKNLDDLIVAYYELYPNKRKEKVYFFLDEIQNIEGWELFVRRIYDTLNIQIYITGSSSKLLSSEIATSLRGRTITYEIFPFSFKEYLVHKKIKVNLHSSSSISFIKNAFNSYLMEGGFAETFDETKEVQRLILKDYLDLIVYKDVIERYAIKNHSLLKHLIKYFFVNMGTLVSFNKLYNEYKSMGFKVGKDTIYDYVSYLQEAYTVFMMPISRNSVKEEMRNPKKIYVIDNGFKQLFDISVSKDYSKLYENVVFLHLRRKTQEVFYLKEKQEVDFYLKNEKKLINVSYEIENKSTLNRELKSLEEGMKNLNLKESFLITSEREEEIKLDEKTVFVIPLWKWLLS